MPHAGKQVLSDSKRGSMSGLRPHYSRWREANGLVFVSGHLAFDDAGRIHGTTIAEQTRICLRNLAATLAAAGLELADVVKTTVWIARKEDFPEFNTAYAAFFPEHPPARSTVVSALAAPGALVEIEAVAQRKTG